MLKEHYEVQFIQICRNSGSIISKSVHIKRLNGEQKELTDTIKRYQHTIQQYKEREEKLSRQMDEKMTESQKQAKEKDNEVEKLLMKNLEKDTDMTKKNERIF